MSTCAREPVRIGLARATLARWEQERGVRLRILAFGHPVEAVRGHKAEIAHWGEQGPQPGPFDPSERLRRVVAEWQAASNIYILADDDCLPLERDFLQRALEILATHGDFGCLCLKTLPDNPYPPQGMYQDGTVWESGSAGGIRFVRRGIVTEFPPASERESYDGPHSAAFYAAGFRVGYFQQLRALHLGYGYSTGQCGP